MKKRQMTMAKIAREREVKERRERKLEKKRVAAAERKAAAEVERHGVAPAGVGDAQTQAAVDA